MSEAFYQLYLCHDPNEITAWSPRKVIKCQSCHLCKVAIVFMAFNYKIIAIIFQLNYGQKNMTVSLAVLRSTKCGFC